MSLQDIVLVHEGNDNTIIGGCDIKKHHLGGIHGIVAVHAHYGAADKNSGSPDKDYEKNGEMIQYPVFSFCPFHVIPPQ